MPTAELAAVQHDASPGGARIGPVAGSFGLGTGRVASAIAAALAPHAPRRVIVVGDELGRALARRDLPVIVLAERPRKRKKGPPRIAANPLRPPLADECADAVIVAGLPDDALGVLAALSAIVRDGGYLGFVTDGGSLLRKPAAPELLSALAVHAALVEIEQRPAGSGLLTLGRVRKWGRAAM